MTDILLANKIAMQVAYLGGRVYFVGGCVRDRLMGRESKDIDIEVHGITSKQLEGVLESFGRWKEVGKSFGIYMPEHYTLDVALPRSERQTGPRHRDFAVEVDPFIGTKKAARRRDFTVNAMMEDVLSGEIIDHFGGREDLTARILRHVDGSTFPEDPLRVLRGAQFAARFDFRLHSDTLAICREISLDELSCERVFEELKKALLGAEKPSRFFKILRECGHLGVWFSELHDLIGVKQDPRYHAEGDVWNHTMMVLDAAAELRDKAKEPLSFMLAALFHDLGKALCTVEEGDALHAYGHETEGLPLVRRALGRLTKERGLLRYVLNMTELHMRPVTLAIQNASQKSTNRLFDRSVCPEDLLLLGKADDLGRIPRSAVDHTPYLVKRLADYKALMALPQVGGEDLIAAGLSPDGHFKTLLEYAHKLHLSGVDKQAALKQTLSYYKELIK